MLTGKGLMSKLLLALSWVLLTACSGGDGTLFGGADDLDGLRPVVGDVQLKFEPVSGSETDVLLTARVVDPNNQLVEGALVSFLLDGDVPEGAFLVVNSTVTNANGEVTAILEFPPGSVDPIRVVVLVDSGTDGKAPIRREINVTPGQEDVRPDVFNLVVDVDRDTGDENTFTVVTTAVGRLNQPLQDAVIFVRLGAGAPAGVSIVVSNPVTNAAGEVVATVRVPDGLTSPIPLLVSVDDPDSTLAPVSITVLPPGVAGVVGGLQVVNTDPGTGNENEVGLLARVVGQNNELLNGVPVFFDLAAGSPAGAFIRVPDPLADGDEGALAILTFPPGFTDTIDVIVTVQTGDTVNPTISRTVSVGLVTIETPFVSTLQLRAEYDDGSLDDNEVIVRARALGRFNEIVDGATIFFRLGAGAPAGATLRVPIQDPVTQGTEGIIAIVTFPEGFAGVVPVVASVVGSSDDVPDPQSINVLSPFARSPVGGLQLVGARIGNTAEVQITARVVDTNSALLAGVPVRFRLAANSPAGSFLRVTQAETLDDGAATAIVTFPSPDSEVTIGVFAEVDTGLPGNPVIQRSLDVTLGIEDTTPLVADIELDTVPNASDPQAVDIYARVLGVGRGLVDDVLVSFAYGGAIPAGAQLFSTQPITSGANGAIATLVFPDGFTSPITVVASARGRSNSFASKGISVPSPIVLSEPEPDVAALRLVATSNTLNSDADLVTEGVTLTAIATDGSNNLLEGATILFTTCELIVGSCGQALDPGGAGALLINRAKTDANGTAEAVVTTAGNVRNRRIRITASSRKNPAISAVFDITVTGTNITLIGPAQLANNSSATYTATLRNSGGFVVSGEDVRFVQVLKPNNQPFLNVNDRAGLLQACANGTLLGTVETGANGAAAFTVTQPTQDFTLLACALQNSQAAAINVGVADTGLTVDFESPGAADPEVNFGLCREIELRFTATDTVTYPLLGQSIELGITRGGVFSDAACTTPTTSVSTTVVDSGAGVATAYVSSGGVNGAGQATLTASHVSGATDTLVIEFVAINPTRVDVSAEPSTVAVNGSATIRAVVRDADNNLVKNRIVNFNLNDPSGGSLNSASQTTDSQGRAEVTYTASSTPSARDAVVVTASVSGTALTDQVNLTVGGNALRISIGTGNTVLEPNPTTYQLPFVAIVTDAVGNPAPPETQFRISVRALTYDKGIYVLNTDDLWVKTTGLVIGDDPNVDNIGPPNFGPDDPTAFDGLSGEVFYAFGCPNEDIDLDGILDVGEDYNGNGILTPGNVVSVPSSVPLAGDGTGQFNLTYAQQYANWVQVELRVIASVFGTETTETQTFFLPGNAEDFSNPQVSPPGQPSPFGTSTTCFDAF
ncbi:MAG: hypothetical protein ACPHCJ_03675, partial [Oceanococcaceae bacterium]